MRSRLSKGKKDESDKDRGEDGMGRGESKTQSRDGEWTTRLGGTEQSRYEQSGADTVRKPTTRLCSWFVTHG